MQRRHHSRSLGHTALGYAALGVLAAACGSGGGTSAGAGSETNPPHAGTVNDGTGADIDEQTSTTTIAANWSGFLDDEGPIAGYRWAIGTTPGGTEVQAWAEVGTATSASNDQLALTVGTTCYVSVIATDGAGNDSPVAISDGVTILAGQGGGGGTGGGGGGGGGGQTGTMASSISQWGITWRFDHTYPVGQFANGDWWVVGPIAVVEISPPTQVVSGRTINGSMVNPVPNGDHGYDSLLYGGTAGYGGDHFKPALNVATGVSSAHPLHLAGSSSLISTVSQMTPDANSISQLSTAAVLTVLASAPAADAFRPAYSGTDKTIRWRERDLDYSVLGRLAPIAGSPTPAAAAAVFQRVWLDHCPGWLSRYMHPVLNMHDYGRDFTSDMGSGALVLQFNYTNAQKRDLLVRMAQLGIDDWGNVQNGCSWPGEGGHGSGRKFPILLAGRALHDTAMGNVGFTHVSRYDGPSAPTNASYFGEDCQTFVVQESSPGVFNWGYGGYTSAERNLVEWGIMHTTYPVNDRAGWGDNPYRRCCTANAWIAQLLAARIMGLRTAWNHAVLFDYQDRFMATETGWTRAWETWHATAWDTYRAQF